jgi:acetoin utilization deacetylase AcuC-like enzyme
MTTALITHRFCLDHEVPPGHPESPARLRAVLGALEAEMFAPLLRLEARAATIEEIARVHPRRHVEAVLAAVPREGFAGIDGDTLMSPGSGQAMLHAAGAVIDAVERVAAGEVKNAFCAVRPPGHHAEPDRSMGFCFFNNVAVGAAHARAVYGMNRVAIVDFDVHHGNGTEAFARAGTGLFYGSSHQSPLYPGTGISQAGNIVNVLLPPGAGGGEFRQMVSAQLLPALDSFAPDLVMISAGFDAHARDPLADLYLTEHDYSWITAELMEIADRHAGGRIVSVLEGGYDLRALTICTAAHVRALMGQ